MLHCSPSQQNGDQSSGLLVIDRSDVRDAFLAHVHYIGAMKEPSWESELAPGYWVGGSDSEMEGVWRWSDTNKSAIPTQPGQPGYQNWYRQAGRNEPSNAVGNEDCMYVSNIAQSQNYPNLFGSWLSSNCVVKKYFVCQANEPSKFKSFLGIKISY